MRAKRSLELDIMLGLVAGKSRENHGFDGLTASRKLPA
jgi:hypothetical protein